MQITKTRHDECSIHPVNDIEVLKALGIELSIDRLLFADGLLCAMGWCASRHEQTIEASLILRFSDASLRELQLDCQLDRPDVPESKPGLPSACGFFLYTPLVTATPLKQVLLRVIHGDQAPVYLDLPLDGLSQANSNKKNQRALFLYYLARTWDHLRQGNWRLLTQRIRATWPALIARRADENQLSHMLDSLPDNAILIVDHALGGGANHYRDTLIDEFLAQKRGVLLWTFSPAILEFHLEIFLPNNEHECYKINPSVWEDLCRCEKIKQLVFNNCVAFPQPERVPDMLANFASSYHSRKLTLLIHDFFLVCPSHFLLNAKGQYCGIPDVNTCKICLPAIDNTLTQLFGAQDIVLWRKLWSNALRRADAIICFSDASRNLLLRGYPDLVMTNILVRPHKLDYLSGDYRYPSSRSPTRVAMVGAISQHKGSDQFISLAKALQASESEIELVVIGSLIANEKPKNIIETGPYQREQLPNLLQKYGIHLVLVLSICPETFSYVTHELIHLGVPLIAYNIGAQGDAAARYPLGRAIPFCNGTALLEIVNDFKAELDKHFFPV